MKRRKRKLHSVRRRDFWDNPKIYAVWDWTVDKLKFKLGRTKDKLLKRMIKEELEKRKKWWSERV